MTKRRSFTTWEAGAETGAEAERGVVRGRRGRGRTRRRSRSSNIGGVNVAIKVAAAAVAVAAIAAAVLDTGPARNLLCYVVCTWLPRQATAAAGGPGCLAGIRLPFGQLNEPVICTCIHKMGVSMCVCCCVCAWSYFNTKHEKNVEAESAPNQGQPKDNAYLRVAPSETPPLPSETSTLCSLRYFMLLFCCHTQYTQYTHSHTLTHTATHTCTQTRAVCLFFQFYILQNGRGNVSCLCLSRCWR